ncbi:hypothetical protein GCM10009854_46730 [Saccharopolyspora halophila]|uniref:Cas12f1-like TNB domain-containing protein n=1 Tax=Saccharopolyspora halophila TaxID=405551 RepID=A0ABN3GVC4_9PSEU
MRARITDRGRDHLHEVTTRLVRENQTVVIEDLDVRGTLGNGTFVRAISDASWSQSRTVLECEASRDGREVIAVDQWFPSSETCSVCGRLTGKMPRNVRTWTCSGCETTHDRDVNAAKNILAAGLAVSARGAGVRPQRESSRTGQSAVKQEPSGGARWKTPPSGGGEGQGSASCVRGDVWVTASVAVLINGAVSFRGRGSSRFSVGWFNSVS